jgi:hypothetical protein
VTRATATGQEAIDETGYGRFKRRLLAVCGVTWAADAAEVLLVGFALPSIRAEFGLDAVTGGLLATAGFAGMLPGAWFWGPAADRIGRRRGFVLTVAVFSVFGLAAAFAPSPGWLMLFRFLAGFGLGGALPLDFSLYAEYLPSRLRGRWLVLLESFWAVGAVVAAGLAWLLVPTVGWRPLMATSALAALLVLWIRARVPESPRWMVVAGRTAEARDVIAQVAGVREDMPQESNRITLNTDVLDQHGLPVPNVHFDDHRNDVAMREHGYARADLLYEAVGALSVHHTPPYPSTHNLGTCRMSERPEDGVVDRWGRAHDVPNLFVSDGSVMTTGAAANPTLTIVALATRQADHILAEMNAGNL